MTTGQESLFAEPVPEPPHHMAEYLAAQLAVWTVGARKLKADERAAMHELAAETFRAAARVLA